MNRHITSHTLTAPRSRPELRKSRTDVWVIFGRGGWVGGRRGRAWQGRSGQRSSPYRAPISCTACGRPSWIPTGIATAGRPRALTAMAMRIVLSSSATRLSSRSIRPAVELRWRWGPRSMGGSAGTVPRPAAPGEGDVALLDRRDVGVPGRVEERRYVPLGVDRVEAAAGATRIASVARDRQWRHAGRDHRSDHPHGVLCRLACRDVGRAGRLHGAGRR